MCFLKEKMLLCIAKHMGVNCFIIDSMLSVLIQMQYYKSIFQLFFAKKAHEYFLRQVQFVRDHHSKIYVTQTVSNIFYQKDMTH